MKKKQWFITYTILILSIAIAYSLSQSNPSVSIITKEEEVIPLEQEISLTSYELWIEQKDYSLSLYEPRKGAYLGAYILSNKNLQFDIKSFENRTQKSHGIYIRHLRLGDPFPLDWILECASQMKTPHLIIHPPSKAFPYQEQLLEGTAEELGEFFVPIFVQFYPDFSHYFGNHIEYQDFFRKAYTIFKKKAPNISMIWSLSSDYIYESHLYDPGDEYIDWIGLNLYIEADSNQEKKLDVLATLDEFYLMYQHRKPLMISQLGISHYSTVDHRYYIEQANGLLKDIYTSLKTRYPKVKAVHYMDFNNIEIQSFDLGQENFCVTEQDELLHNYQNLILPPYFLNELEVQYKGFLQEEWIRVNDFIYEKDGSFYVTEQFFINPYIKKKFSTFQLEPLLSGEYPLYSLDSIAQAIKYHLKVDSKQNRIYLITDRS